MSAVNLSPATTGTLQKPIVLFHVHPTGILKSFYTRLGRNFLDAQPRLYVGVRESDEDIRAEIQYGRGRIRLTLDREEIDLRTENGVTTRQWYAKQLRRIQAALGQHHDLAITHFFPVGIETQTLLGLQRLSIQDGSFFRVLAFGDDLIETKRQGIEVASIAAAFREVNEKVIDPILG